MTRPVALPPSGRASSAGSVSVQQTTSLSGNDTLSTSVQVSDSPFHLNMVSIFE